MAGSIRGIPKRAHKKAALGREEGGIKIWEIIRDIMHLVLIFLTGSYLVSRYFDRKQQRKIEDLRKLLIKIAWQERKELRRLEKFNEKLEKKFNS